MSLQVPLIAQQNTTDCVYTCLKIVLGYYNLSVDQKSLQSLTRASASSSRFNIDAALYASIASLKVDCFGYNHHYASPVDVKLSQEQLLKVLEERVAVEVRSRYRPMLRSVIKAMKAGTNYILEQPNLPRIRSYLRQHIPLIVSVSPCALYKVKGDPYAGHDIVLTGISGSRISIIDPRLPTEQWMDAETIMFAILARKVTAIPSYLVAIRPKNKEKLDMPLRPNGWPKNFK